MLTRRFGVEIEAVGMSTNEAAHVLRMAGFTCEDEGYNHTTRDHWKVVMDSSTGGGFEVVSPPLSGEAGLDEVRRVCEALNEAGAGVNRNCGLHVHVDAAGMDARWIGNVLRRYFDNVDEIDAFMPESRRGDNNHYCRNLDRYTVNTMVSRDDPFDMARCVVGRYYKVNMQSYIRHGTLEFRQHSGTINFTKIRNWILFLLQFVEASRPTVNETPVTSVEEAIRENGYSPRKVQALYDYMVTYGNDDIGYNYCRISDIREQMGWNSDNTVRTFIQQLRRAVRRLGMDIRYHRSLRAYRLLTNDMYMFPRERRRINRTNIDLTDETTTRNLWDGIEMTIRNFYYNRARALGGA